MFHNWSTPNDDRNTVLIINDFVFLCFVMNERLLITKPFKTPALITSSLYAIAPFNHVLYRNRPSCYALISVEAIAGSTLKLVTE